MTNLIAPGLKRMSVSVTRKMSASLPGLRRLAQDKGLKIHHLGAGYPHPEVTDPRHFLEHEAGYLEHLTQVEGLNDPSVLPENLREAFSYGDTLGPPSTRQVFARVYGNDWNLEMKPDCLIPTVGATGGISLICSVFENAGLPLAYLTDAPTYAGFMARAGLCQQAKIYSVEMDGEGPIPAVFEQQIVAARAAGRLVPFYYTVPDGHNPAGFSFSAKRRLEILEIARREGILILEDAPYLYINFAAPADRQQPFVSLDPRQTVHLFTGSKIGFPGPRVGYLYSEASIEIANGEQASLAELALLQASADILFPNPAAYLGFEALLHEADFSERTSMWPVAEEKLDVYRENREIMLQGFESSLGAYPDLFHWTIPMAGFFSVFTFLSGTIRTDDEFIRKLVTEYGLVVIPMYDFYPPDARIRNPNAGLDQLRISFCFSESAGEQRRKDLTEAVSTFCTAVKHLAGVD
ncbi:MAG: PLP-dependent aminotransferase family protein [SAR86 cluster bacterium]|uniref:PLP-dependent aminotransferase family protein n=1 Tax=SAR86 cluster bacterium TaxID=2030880 RepID=A0A973A9U6_9GAMM|nr:PLP-dependent aminotransferase family protein [SAR86 cluster bacterium]